MLPLGKPQALRVYVYIVSTGCPNKNHRDFHVLHFHPGLTQQREWQSKPDELSASVFPS